MKSVSASKREFRTLAVTTALALLIIGAGMRFRALKEVPAIVVPPRVMPSPNAYDTLRSATAAYVRPTVPVDKLLLPKSSSSIYLQKDRLAWIKANALSLRLLRKALTQDHALPVNFDARYPSSNYDLMRLLAIESNARRIQGDWPGAAHSAMDIMRLGQLVSRGQGYLSQLQGSSIVRFGAGELAATYRHLDAVTLKSFTVDLESLYARRLLVQHALAEEKLRLKAELVKLVRDGALQSNLDLIESDSEKKTPLVQRRLQLAFLNYNRIFEDFDRYFDALVDESKWPYRTGKIVTVPECSGRNPLFCFIAPVYAKAGETIAHSETTVTLLLVQMGLQAYYTEKGHYPLRLQDLATKHLRAIPIDPYGTGQMIGYKRTNNSYVLYSVGPDGIDNGGRPKPSRQRLGRTIWPVSGDEKGDLVAGLHYK